MEPNNVNGNASLEDLEEELLKDDPDFNPNDSINWKPIISETEYPEIKEVWRGNKPAHKILDTHVNLAFLLSKFNARLRHNMMTRKREIEVPGLYIFKDDADNDSLSRIEYLATVNHLEYRQVDKFLDMLCVQHAYHPIADAVQAIPWDGITRLDRFIDTIKSTNPAIDRIIIRTWMTAAIASVFSPDGFTNHGVLVLQGEQGLGKTEWVKRLDPINCGAVAVGVLLDPRNKDSIIGANRFWIIELGELDATLNKTDIAHLKSFITSPVDHIRVPWGRRESRLVRRTAYVATVNEHNFLVDTTGNRRWWTVSATNIDYQHDFDMQQVWAEVYAEWRNGALTYLPRDLQQLVNEKNKDHERLDPLEEKLRDWYDWDSQVRKELTVSSILEEIGYTRPNRDECTRAGKILTKINGKKGRKSNGSVLHSIPFHINLRNR